MEDGGLQIRSFIKVWITVVASLCYCHAASRFFRPGRLRLLAFSPAILLFLLLPLNLTTISLGGLTAFFVAWLCNFKLLLLAFDVGPLASFPTSLPLHLFLALACLPIKPRYDKPSAPSSGLKSVANYTVKCMVIVGFLPFYAMKEMVPTVVIRVMYCVHGYVGLEVSLAAVGAVARGLAGIELEPQFNEPYLSSSLQDFWGRRWNLMVTNILHPSVYIPIRSIASRVIGRKWATLPAVFSSFAVSAMMHELIFYYIGRKQPNWVVTRFFLLHGTCVAAEIAAKKALPGKFKLPRAVSTLSTMGFILGTALWLFLPPLLRCDAEEKSRSEAMAVAGLLKKACSVLGLASFTIVN